MSLPLGPETRQVAAQGSNSTVAFFCDPNT